MTTPKVFPAGTSLTNNIGEEWTKESGAVQVQTLEGNLTEILAGYNAMKASAAAFGAGNVASLGYEANRGRSRMIIRYAHTNGNVEELYAVDVIRDIREAPYFATLTDAMIVAVKTAHDNGQAAADPAWNVGQNVLWTHFAHGVESYIDKQFILRTSQYVSIATVLSANFNGLGTVVDAPALSSDMTRLVASLPAGEWLQGPVTAEHLGRGQWRVDNEVQWAKKWSVIYGGTLFAP